MAGPYITFTVTFTGGPVDTSFRLDRSLTATGPWEVVQDNVPLLDEIAVVVDNTAPIGVDLWYRLVSLQNGTTTIHGPFSLPENGHVWVKDPARPWADVQMDTCPTSGPVAPCTDPDPVIVWGGLKGLSQADNANIFEILNSDVPADIWGRRKSIEASMIFFTRSLDATDRIYDLFTAGGPLQLQLPDIYGWHDAFIQPFELTWEYGSRDQRRPLRRYEVRFRVVDRPLGPIQGTACANWCAVEDIFPTMGDMVTGQTWLALAEGLVLCDANGQPIVPISDTFSRTVASGWGAADTGQVWTVRDGAAADFSVNGTQGLHTHAALNAFHTVSAPWTDADVSLRSDFSLNVVPAADGADFHFLARFQDVNNYYDARVFVASGGSMMLTLRKRLAGVESQLATITPGLTYVADAVYSIRFAIQGTSLMTKIWLASAPEPAAWQITAVDASFPGPGAVGYRTFPRAGLTNPLPIIFRFDNLAVV